MENRKGRIPPSATVRGGPTPGPRYTPKDSGRGDGGHDYGSSSYGHGRSHGHHHHGHFGFRFGLGSGFYGFLGYPYYFGHHYYRPYYDFGLGYYSPGYYPYYYGSSTRYRTVRVEPQGGLDLNVRPKDTQVYLNGYYIGTTGDFDGWPRYLWLDEDVHELIFYKEGYETVVREVSVQPDVVVNVKFQMQPGPSTSPEELTRYKDRDLEDSSYSGAPYYGDDRDRGYRDPGDAGRDPYGELPRRESRYGERYGEPPPDRPAPEAPEGLDLRTDAGHLLLQVSPPEASVYIDGRFVGIGGMLAELETGLLMDEGQHRIQVLHPQYETEETTFTVTAGKETKLDFQLQDK